MSYYNPLNLPLDNLSEEAGTLQFTLASSDVLDLSADNRYFFDVKLGESHFELLRDKHLNVRFIHACSGTDIRIATISLAGLRASERLSVILTWSKEGDSLSVSDVFSPNYVYAAQQTKGGVLPREGNSASVHGKLWSTGSYRKSAANVELSEAKGLWDWHLASVYNLIDGLSACWSVQECKWRNALFKSTVSMQCIVILVTGFEAYTRKRFAEMEEGKSPNINALLKRFDSKNYSKKEREEYVKATGRSNLSSILEIRNGKGLINFQNFQQCKDAFNKVMASSLEICGI
ncbi:MAG: hypothetical protein ACXV5H_11105 [Halobacteriota archaeon]